MSCMCALSAGDRLAARFCVSKRSSGDEEDKTEIELNRMPAKYTEKLVGCLVTW